MWVPRAATLPTVTPSTTPTARTATLPAPSPLARHWSLDPTIVFLNHGSFGATPKAVLAAQQRYRDQLEREPIDFFINQHTPLMDATREAIGAFVHAPPSSIAPIQNATIGVASVLANLKLKPGDEVLINDHEYPACQNNIRRTAARTGAKVVVAEPPFPCKSPDAITDAILSKVTARTRLALISHVTSPTGLIFPIDTLVPELTRRGVLTLIDGAHAPGMVPTLNLSTLKPTFYTANLHKWVCSPKGSAFLYVDPAHQQGFRPVILSNNAEKPRPGRAHFLTEFDYIGTQDNTGLYSMIDALAHVPTLVPGGGGWPEVMRRNHDLCIAGRNIICRELYIEPPAPDSMIGSISTMILPPHPPALQAKLSARPTNYHDALQDTLIARHRIQVPVMSLPGKPARLIRISAQLYNSLEQYECLAAALKEELAAERALG